MHHREFLGAYLIKLQLIIPNLICVSCHASRVTYELFQGSSSQFCCIACFVCMFAHVNLLFSIIDKKLAQSWPWTKKVRTKQQIWHPLTATSNKKALSEGPDPIRATTTTGWRAHYYDARGYDVGKIAPVSPLFTFQDQPRAATGHNPVSLCARRRFHCILTM